MILQLKDPIREMYEEFKQQHKGTIMLTEDNDRYTAYYEDTEPVSDALDFFYDEEQRATSVTFSKKYLDIVLPLLVKKGYKIAIRKITKQTKI